jgi:hypothetical protein
MKPFFCFFGGKWRIAPHYPAPRFKNIIEPFAGAAGYSVRYASANVTLYEIDPKIFGVWDYLLKASTDDVLRLPVQVENVDTLKVCQEARWLIGFWLNKGTSQPSKTPSRWMRDGIRPNSFWGTVIRSRIAYQVPAIRHWKVKNKSWCEVPNVAATFFIDPPYQAAGKGYKFNDVPYKELGAWCRGLHGQVMVCEAAGANWLPFKPFRKIKTLEGSNGKKTGYEVLWYKSLPAPPAKRDECPEVES